MLTALAFLVALVVVVFAFGLAQPIAALASTATVDAWYKHGARLLLRHQWRSEQWNTQGIGATDYEVPQVAFPSFSIPKAVIDWYGPLWRLASRDPSRPTGGFV